MKTEEIKLEHVKGVCNSKFFVQANRSFNREGFSSVTFQLCLCGEVWATAYSVQDLRDLRDSLNVAIAYAEKSHEGLGDLSNEKEEDDYDEQD